MAKKKIIGRHDKVMDLTYGKKYNPQSRLNAAAEGSIFSNLGSIFGGITPMVQGFMGNRSIKNKDDYEQEARLGASETFNGIQSIDALQAAREAYAPMPFVTKDDLSISKSEKVGNVLTSTLGGLGAGLETGNPYIAGATTIAGLGAGLGGIWAGNRRARKRAQELSDLREAREDRLDRAFNYQLGNIYENSYNRLMANYSDAGGLLGGNRHKFGTGSASMPDVFTHGGIFSNGMQLIDAGGSHEENPNDGVTVSYDANGVPNKVEEGEVIFNDYVFSNRFAPDRDLLEKYNLPKAWENHTFAYIAEVMGRESRERPNDPISKRGLESSMETLTAMQEEYKEAERQKEIAKAIKRMTPEEKAAMFDAASQQMQEQYETPEEMYVAENPYPEEEVPVFMPQQYAAGGNIFAAGDSVEKQGGPGTPSYPFGGLSRFVDPSGNGMSMEEVQRQIQYEKEARDYAMTYLLSIGEKPTERKINRIARDIAYQGMLSFSGNTVGIASENRQRWLPRELWNSHNGRYNFNILSSEPSKEQSKQSKKAEVPEKPAQTASAEDRVASAAASGNLGRFTTFSYNPHSGRSGGNRNSNPEAGSATKAAETAPESLPPAPDIAFGDTVYGAPANVRLFRDLISADSDAGKRLTGAAKTELDRVLSRRSVLGQEDREAFARQALGRGVGSDRENPIEEDRGLPTGLRYAGAAFSGLGALASLLTPPDYTHVDEIRNAGIPYGEVTFRPVENYLTYRPIDRNYMINQMRNQSLGTARQLVNASGANPGTSVAGLMGLNFGTNQAIGQGLIQADLANRAHEAQVREFNRGTDQYNSEGMFKESVYNRDRFQPLTQPRILAAQIAAQEDALTAQARSNNLTNFADNLTAIGNENAYMNMVKSDPSLYYQWGYNPRRFGMMTYRPASCGGTLKTRKKRR